MLQRDSLSYLIVSCFLLISILIRIVEWISIKLLLKIIFPCNFILFLSVFDRY